MRYEIKHRYNGQILYSGKGETLAAVVTQAVSSNANLYGAYLSGADLSNADLRNANLSNANLYGAYLSGADLSNSNLRNANLYGAYLSGADLFGADEIAADIYDVFAYAPHEVPGVLAALRAGKVDGSTYSGPCACLVGTICNLRGVEADRQTDIPRNSGRPAERWFMAIRPGDTPENHPIARITAEWIEEFIASNPEAMMKAGMP